MSLFAELKRRNVVKVATVYLVASWLLLQITDVLSSLLALPAAVGTTVVALLAVGFFPVLIFSWIYELTPGGLRRESEIEPGDSMAHVTGRRMNALIIVLVLVAIAVIVLLRALPEATDTPAAGAPAVTPASGHERPSIAVLPFENFSGDKADDYFSDGLADTLLHHLAQVPGLTVIARNSSFQFKGTNLDMREIGRRLGVANVLEGSVQRYGDKLRVIAQLIDTADGSHVWSESFDYSMQDIFALHDAIAKAVVSQLRLSLLPRDAAAISQGGTASTEAYDLYLRALDYGGEMSPSLVESIDDFDNFPAVQMLRAALVIDPDYVDAMVALADFYNGCAFMSSTHERYETCLGEMKPLVARALELAPAYSRSWAVKGRYEHRSGDTDASKVSLARALELNPNDAETHLSYAVAVMTDDPETALEHMDISDRLDPAEHFDRPRVMALSILGRTREAIETLEAGLPDGDNTEMELQDLAALTYRLQGQPATSARWTSRLLQQVPGAYYGDFNLTRLWLAVGDLQRAGRWLAAAQARQPDDRDLAEFRLQLALLRDGPAAAAAHLGGMTWPNGAPSISARVWRYALCLLDADTGCAQASDSALETGLATVPGDDYTATRNKQRLYRAELAELEGAADDSGVRSLLDDLAPLPRLALINGKKTLDIEADILLGHTADALAGLAETLLPDGGFIPWDSYGLPLDSGHLVSRLAGNTDFERWKAAYVARRDAAREAMLQMEADGTLPAPPESTP